MYDPLLEAGATERHHQLLREAEHGRLIKTMRGDRPSPRIRVLVTIAGWLIRWGEVLNDGSQPAPPNSFVVVHPSPGVDGRTEPAACTPCRYTLPLATCEPPGRRCWDTPYAAWSCAPLSAALRHLREPRGGSAESVAGQSRRRRW